ncbi:MAG: hypothetical protein WA892_11825, partial [Ornithinimicrobium sp.]
MAATLRIRDRGRGVTPADVSEIQDALTQALLMAEAATAQMAGIWDQPGRVRRRRRRREDAWARHALFVRWFGTSTRPLLIRRLRRRMEKIRTWLDTGRIVVLAHDDGDRLCEGANAFATVPRRPIKVHLCQSWFALSPTRQAAVVIHELVHELGFAHPSGATSPAAARAVAAAVSRRARR